jgi:putative ABC transport system permease protein
MIKNYFKIAWRNLVKNKFTSFVNISGLAIGIAVAMLIGLWIWDELSFNKNHANYNSIAQLARSENVNGEIHISENSNFLPIPLANELRTSYGSYFKQVSLASTSREHILAFNNNKFSRLGMYVEPGFTEMFTLKMVGGTANGFSDPNTILINQSLARSLFDKEEAVGKTLKVNNSLSVKVAGVFEDLPYSSSFSETSFFCPFSLLLSSNEGVKRDKDNWKNSSFHIYVQATPGISMATISDRTKDAYWARTKDQQAAANSRTSTFLHPMKNWHLRSEWKNGVQAGGRIQMVWLFGIIASFVLLLACINFMNLSTAHSEKRAREVGIRKSIGSLRGQLIRQFLSESFVVACIAFGVALLLVSLSLNWFNEIADKKITFPLLNPVFWMVSFGFVLVTALAAGSYPALYLSSFKPIKVLKGSFQAGKLTVIPRRVMVIVQFTVSITLIIGTIVIYRQIMHAQDRPIGYNKNGLIRIQMNTADLNGKYDVLRKEVFQTGGAIAYAQSSTPATQLNFFDGGIEWEGKDPNRPQMTFALMAVTYDFGQTIGWQFLQGRDFSRTFSTDPASVVLNEAAVKYMQLRDPVGKTLKWNGNNYKVIGVIRDMVMSSPYDPVQQGVFFLFPGIGPHITIRLNPGLSTSEAIRRIEPVFTRHNPSSPFEYKFVDEEYGRKFASEQRIGTLASFFAGLAIFISCLGIFGLATFVAERRKKEISVRKVLGASVTNLWGLLSKEFLVLVVISFLIAAPIAWYYLGQWLQKYEYRTDISWWIFAVAIGGALTITLLTVSFQAIKAAITNPVKSLRTE